MGRRFGGVTGRRVGREHKCDLAGKKRINQSIQTKLVYLDLSIENSRNYRLKRTNSMSVVCSNQTIINIYYYPSWWGVYAYTLM